MIHWSVSKLLTGSVGRKVWYREVQVKYGRLWHVGSTWERELFDVSSWKFFRPDEFKDSPDYLFIVYVLSLPPPDGYKGDLFVFPVRVFQRLIQAAVSINSKKGPRKDVRFMRALADGKWYLRTKRKFGKADFGVSTMCVQQYWRNFGLLGTSEAS